MSKLYTLALIFILFSCDSRRIVSNDDTIFVDYDKEQIFDWNNTILIKSVVSLETADDCVLSYARKCLVSGKYIVYHDEKQKAIFVFDEEGTFLYVIDAVGGGPDEYTEIKDMAISCDKEFILVLDNNSVVSFDLKNGRFQDRISLPQNIASNFYRFANVDKQTFYFWSTEKENSLYLYENGEIKVIEKRTGFPFVCQKFYYDSENSLNYISDYGLFEIHGLEQERVRKKYSFDFGYLNFSKSQMPKNVTEFEQVDDDESFKCIMSAFETDDDLFIMTVSPDGMLYNICLDKITHEVRAGKQDENAPLLVIDAVGRYFYGIIYPYHFSKSGKLTELIDTCGGNEDSNPILVKFMFKK